MSDEDLQYAIARNIAHVIPGLDEQTYLRAARGAAVMWRSEYDKGYRAGKESGLMESTHGGEIATLRARLSLAERRVCPDRFLHEPTPIRSGSEED
jgi:hypothetical protein